MAYMGSPPCAIFRYPDDLRNIVQQCATLPISFQFGQLIFIGANYPKSMVQAFMFVIIVAETPLTANPVSCINYSEEWLLVA